MLLAFDTATPLVTVAVQDGHQVVAERFSADPMRHGEQLAPLIEETLADAGCARGDLTRIAVGTGPGPFTGLRVGLVTARTLGHVLGVPVVGVCTLDAIAAEVADSRPRHGFLVATDARRREVYWASYDEHGRRTAGPEVGPAAAIATDAPVAGGGAALYPDALPTPIGPERPSAGWLARCLTGGLAELSEPEPLYLRRPDAMTPGARKRVS
ncbi:MAG: tRNA (adenosine(37)-N6)-threonylcarbamoyltransferase complex dimerization subunit type 1 TsaB [Nocardioides sp.]